MSDRAREIHGGYDDRPSRGECRAEYLEAMAAIETGDLSAVAPWSTPEETLVEFGHIVQSLGGFYDAHVVARGELIATWTSEGQMSRCATCSSVIDPTEPHTCSLPVGQIERLDRRAAARAGHDSAPYPHEGGCEGCWAKYLCNACGTSILRDRGRCTNGRCSACHGSHCTPGGETSSGHGYGRIGVQSRAREGGVR